MACILVVEDAREWRVLYTAVLEAEGHKVMSACDGQEALLLFDKYRCSFDLVITDLIMPGLDGLQLIAQLNLRANGLPIMLITGDYSGKTLLTSLIHNKTVKSLPANDLSKRTDITVWQKPLPNEALVDAVARILQAPHDDEGGGY